MDHHCPWIYNCVGWKNHKYFMLSLIYGSLTSLLIAACMFESVKRLVSSEKVGALPLAGILARSGFEYTSGVQYARADACRGTGGLPWCFAFVFQSDSFWWLLLLFHLLNKRRPLTHFRGYKKLRCKVAGVLCG